MRRRDFLTGAGAMAGCVLLRPLDAAAAGRLAHRLRFGVVSDVHLGGPGTVEDLEKSLRHFDAEGVDAVMVPGDIAHSGLISEMEQFAAVWQRVFPKGCGADGRSVEKLLVTGNHDIDGWPGRWKDFSTADLAAKRFNWGDNPQRLWSRFFDEPWQLMWRRQVKGVTFVGAQWKSELAPFLDPKIEDYFAREKATLGLEQPFFFVQHAHPAKTCYTPMGDGDDHGEATRALASFPNAVAISGHSHFTTADPRTVWQGAFTSIGAGCLYEAGTVLGYANVNYNWHRPSWKKVQAHAPWFRRGGNDMVVDVYADWLVLHRRSAFYDESLGEDWVVPFPARVGGPFDFDVRARAAQPAAFEPDAKVEAVYCPKGHELESRRFSGSPCVAITFPAAQSPNDIVRCYEVTAVSGERVVARKKFGANGFGLSKKRMNEPGVALFAASELPMGRSLIFCVRAETCWGGQSAAIRTKFPLVL